MLNVITGKPIICRVKMGRIMPCPRGSKCNRETGFCCSGDGGEEIDELPDPHRGGLGGKTIEPIVFPPGGPDSTEITDGPDDKENGWPLTENNPQDSLSGAKGVPCRSAVGETMRACASPETAAVNAPRTLAMPSRPTEETAFASGDVSGSIACLLNDVSGEVQV